MPRKPHSFLNLTLSLISYELDETTYRNLEIISLIFPQKNWHYRFFRESRIPVLFWQGPVFTCEYIPVLYKVFHFELTHFCLGVFVSSSQIESSKAIVAMCQSPLSCVGAEVTI